MWRPLKTNAQLIVGAKVKLNDVEYTIDHIDAIVTLGIAGTPTKSPEIFKLSKENLLGSGAQIYQP